MKSLHRRFRVSLVGAGKVGTTLAVMLKSSGHSVVAVVSRSRRSAEHCGRLVSCRNCSDELSAIPASTDLVLIAVPDRSIRSVAEALARLPHLNTRSLFVLHTSGALTSDELEPLGARGAAVFSFHPVQTFPRNKSVRNQIRTMKGIAYGIEGSLRSLATAKRLAKELKGIPLVVPKEAKILYHCACVIASNYAVTLVGAVEALAGQFAGRTSDLFKPLLETSIANALESGAGTALTGPIVRGDAEVISRHLQSIRDPELRSVYKSLGLFALKLAVKEKKIALDDVDRIDKALREIL